MPGDGGSVCPGCGLRAPSAAGARQATAMASAECLMRYDELSLYTLALRDAFFRHQLIVDAHAAQHAGPDTRPIAVAFALLGLHLFADRGFTGHQVQRAHMALARHRRAWPTFALPTARGTHTVADALAATPGPPRDLAIEAWARSVWAAYAPQRAAVAALADAALA